MRPSGDVDDGVERMLVVVESVPAGRAITYADLSELAGYGGPRTAGAVMAQHGGGVPWHRVVSASGRLPAPLVERAAARWRDEAMPLVAAGDRVDLRRARWMPSPDELEALESRLAATRSAVGGPDHDGAVRSDRTGGRPRGARREPS